MRNLPGWKPLTAFGLVLSLAGLGLLTLSVGLGFLLDAFGSVSPGGGWGLMAAMGFGFTLALVGSSLTVLSLVGYWFGQHARACPLWHSAG